MDPDQRAQGPRSRAIDDRKRALTAAGIGKRDRGILAKNGDEWRQVSAPVQAAQLSLTPVQQQLVREREALFDQLTQHLRRVGERLQRAGANRAVQTELRAYERQFRGLMQRYPRGITDAAGRRRAIAIFDAAYDIARPAWEARRVWVAMYSDDAVRALLNNGRSRGLIKLTSRMIENGNAPLAIGFSPRRNTYRAVFETINIDHAVPLDRNPFRVFDHENWRVTTGPWNQRWANQWSRLQPFSMELSHAADDIEDFVQGNQLSRRQRPTRAALVLASEGIQRPRRGLRALEALAPVIDLMSNRARAEVFSDVADDLRRRAARVAPEPIRHDNVDATNILNRLANVFEGRTPPAVDSRRRRQLVLAFQRGVREDRANRYVFAGWVERADCERLLFLMGEVATTQGYMRTALENVDQWLAPRDSYIARASAIEECAPTGVEGFLDELESFGIDLEDAVTISDNYRWLAQSYRGYVEDLQRIRQLLVDSQVLYEARASLIDEALSAR